MNSSNVLGRHSHRPLQIGVALLLFSSCEGFVIPDLAAPLCGHVACSRLGDEDTARGWEAVDLARPAATGVG
jgi:hypothetical protein